MACWTWSGLCCALWSCAAAGPGRRGAPRRPCPFPERRELPRACDGRCPGVSARAPERGCSAGWRPCGPLGGAAAQGAVGGDRAGDRSGTAARRGAGCVLGWPAGVPAAAVGSREQEPPAGGTGHPGDLGAAAQVVAGTVADGVPRRCGPARGGGVPRAGPAAGGPAAGVVCPAHRWRHRREWWPARDWPRREVVLDPSTGGRGRGRSSMSGRCETRQPPGRACRSSAQRRSVRGAGRTGRPRCHPHGSQ